MPTDTDSEEGEPSADALGEEEVVSMSESNASQTTIEPASDKSDADGTASRPPHLRLVTSKSADAAPKIEDPDVELVEAARNGNQRAFSTLFDRHHGRVHAMCCRLLRDRTEVEDAVQHAFLEAWRCLHKFEGRSKFSTWITRIAIHTCLGIRRKLKRMFFAEDVRPQEAADNDGQWGTAPMAPDEGAVHQARKKAVDDVLQMLSGKKRVVFVLADLEGMTAPEIAEILQIPDATVRTRLFHARKEFAQKVEAHPGFSDLFGGAK